jgi:hypothetical protein
MGWIRCATCAVEVHLEDNVERNLRQTGGSFFCPVGHSSVFTKEPTPDQQEIARLKLRLERLEGDWHDVYACREDLIGVVKECPFGCGYRSRRQIPRDSMTMGRGIERAHTDLRQHLIDEHGARGEVTRQIPERTGDAREGWSHAVATASAEKHPLQEDE